MLSIETMMEEIEHLIPETYEFENRENWKTMAFFGIFGLSGFSCENQNPWCFNRILHYKCKVSIETSMEEIKRDVFGKFEFEKRDQSLFIAVLEFADDPEYDTKKKTIVF